MKRFRGVSRRRKEREEVKGFSPGLFTPDQRNTTLRWGFSGAAAASGTYGETVFSGNGLFDPGVASSATQPVGFDQLATWYNRYHVSGSKISLNIMLQATAATPTATSLGGRICLYPSNTLAAASSFTEAVAQSRAIFKEFGTLPVKLEMSLSSLKALGFNGSNVDSTDSAGIGANPTSQWYWHIGVQSGGYTSVETFLTSHIDFHSTFFYRVTQPLSLFEKLQKEMNLTLRAEIKRRENLPYKSCFVADDTVADEYQETKVLSRLEVERTDGKSVSIDNAGLIPVPLVRQQKIERFVVLNTPSSSSKARTC